MDPWYKVVTPRREVREGRSFSPDEFAIALEQVVAGTAPEDYSDPAKFFSRTCFTRALKDHTGMVLRRLAGKTENTAPVLTLITQFGGGKTHTLTSLYHLANAGGKAARLPGTTDLLAAAGMTAAPAARVGVFVGNAWDPAEGRETPWIDLARQLAGDNGVAALGTAARTTPPGTEALARVFAAADAPVLLLFDEVLNFVNRHRAMAEGFHAFIQNLTVAVTGATRTAAVISLPRSQVEMTDWDQQWQDRITKVVRRVARDLIATTRPRSARLCDGGCSRISVTKSAAARSPRLTRIGASSGLLGFRLSGWRWIRQPRRPGRATSCAAGSRRAILSTRRRSRSFSGKWSALTQFQQTRGTLAMLAQWISWAAREQFQQARTEPLITLGSAPLHVPEFRAVVLGQLGESKLDVAIDADLAGQTAHAKALDVDTKGPLRDIHRRVGAAILFESSGGQVDKVAHLPELRFALGEPAVDTATVDNAATALETAGFFIRRVGTDGYRIHHQATLKKVVSDRRASLDDDSEIKPATRKLIEDEFTRGATLPVVLFPEDGAAIQDSPRLMLVIVDPETEWRDGAAVERIGRWTSERGAAPRLYPGSLVWCAKKPGRELRERVELWLAWRRVEREVAEGVLGTEFDRGDRSELRAKVKDAEVAAKDEVWACYRFVALADAQATSNLKVIDLGAGHASASETLCGRIVAALKSEALLNESVGAGYIDRHWPPALKETGAWPLTSLRQSFLNGALTRLIDPDAVLRQKIVEFVASGYFGLASGTRDDGGYERLWFAEPVGPEEVAFEASVFLLIKERAKKLREIPQQDGDQPKPEPPPPPGPTPTSKPGRDPGSVRDVPKTTLRLTGTVPPETWNRFGTKVIPKLHNVDRLVVEINFTIDLATPTAALVEAELKQILNDLGLGDRVRIERS